MFVLFLSGWSGAGKDTVAFLLQKRYGFQRLAFADPLKEIVARELCLPVNLLHTQEGKAMKLLSGETVREVLIRRGQEIRAAAKDPGFFAKCVADSILNDDRMPTGYVISDWRLMVEFETLTRHLGRGYTVLTARVYRQGQTKSPVASTYTEHGLDSIQFDITLENPGTSLEALEKKIIQTFEPVLKPE
jgi:phosphomevalonate kinase